MSVIHLKDVAPSKFFDVYGKSSLARIPISALKRVVDNDVLDDFLARNDYQHSKSWCDLLNKYGNFLGDS